MILLFINKNYLSIETFYPYEMFNVKLVNKNDRSFEYPDLLT